MITIGVDMGAKNVKVVFLRDREVISKAKVTAGLDAEGALHEALKLASQQADLDFNEIPNITSTGAEIGRASCRERV